MGTGPFKVVEALRASDRKTVYLRISGYIGNGAKAFNEAANIDGADCLDTLLELFDAFASECGGMTGRIEFQLDWKWMATFDQDRRDVEEVKEEFSATKFWA